MKRLIISFLGIIFYLNIYTQKIALNINISYGHNFINKNYKEFPLLFESEFSLKNMTWGLGLSPSYSNNFVKGDSTNKTYKSGAFNPFEPIVAIDAKEGNLNLTIPIFIGYSFVKTNKININARLGFQNVFRIRQYYKGIYQHFKYDTLQYMYNFIENKYYDVKSAFSFKKSYTNIYFGLYGSLKLSDKISVRLLTEYSENSSTLFNFKRSYNQSLYTYLGLSYNVIGNQKKLKYKRRH